MFLGHFAVGFAAKRAAPRASLRTTFLAAQWADVVWPVFLLLGLETVRIDPGNTAVTPLDFVSYPYSHSLLALLLWAGLFAGVYAWRGRDRAGAWVLAAVVLSHWVLDFASHRPDVPVLFDGPKLGLGLWRSLAATLAVEGALFAVGVWLYARATRARDRIGSYGLAALVALLVIAYAGALFGPPPPSVDAILWADLAGMALFVGLASWVDAHRAPREGSSPTAAS